MKNVTVTLPEDVAQWARVEAARQNTSVSRLLGEMLRERMEREQAYARAHDAFLSVRPRRLRDQSEALPTREELHDRPGLR